MNINLGLHLSRRAGLSPDLEAYRGTLHRYAPGLRPAPTRSSTAPRALWLGLQPGERAALLMQNCVEFVALFTRRPSSVSWWCPEHPPDTERAVFYLSDSGAKALFYGAECAELTSGIKTNKDHPTGIDTWVQVHAGQATITAWTPCWRSIRCRTGGGKWRPGQPLYHVHLRHHRPAQGRGSQP